MNKWKIAIISVAGIVCIGFMGTFAIQGSKNKAIAYEQAIEIAESDIHVQEKRRFDLLPNLVEAIKQYDKHEADVLEMNYEKIQMPDDDYIDTIKESFMT